MLFNSIEFVIFALVFFALRPLLNRKDNVRWAFFTAMSFVFYGWWDWRYLSLVLISGVIDYYAAILIIDRPKHRKLWLFASMASNLGILGFFKYFNFFAESVADVAGYFGLSVSGSRLDVILPVGISFYTFQSMSYTIDVYRKELTPTRNVLHFFAFLSLFPQLVAGPILRATDLLPQLVGKRETTATDRWEGLQLILRGFFKKVVVADSLAPVVNQAFGATELSPSAPYWWVIAGMFAFQIYCDFSGYSDIARGLGRWLGMRFCHNFDHPYGSTSVRQFWGRWHMSLSTWFRDYLYIPIGGSRKGQVRSHVNMWITMVASGLWHGANWTYIVWGALHAFYTSVERLTSWPGRVMRLGFVGRMLAAGFVMAQVLVAWVYFRATSLRQANEIVGNMLSFRSSDLSLLAKVDNMVWIALGAIILREAQVFLVREWRPVRSGERGPAIGAETGLEPTWHVREALACAALLTMIVFMRGPGGAFIYFQF